MWSAILDHDGDLESAVTAVVGFYGVEPARVRTDLEHLVTSLNQARLVRTEP
ncbi:hypothetical protein [Lentzea guizhouensis]|uniref:hypothetical protein n=1 Tax=Lentzea guizhouensis TaxID=1586287 RepID=UPI003AB01F01